MADDNIRLIPVLGKHSAGRSAIVDADRYDELRKHKWCANDYGYVTRSEPGTNKHIRMHHDVIGFPPDGFEADHRNGDTYDNRRENLRFSTKEQQMQNRAPWGEIPFKGVLLRKGAIAMSMKVGGVQLNLGTYHSPIEAALAYDAFASYFYGQYARLNFPDSAPMHPKEAQRLRTSGSRKAHPSLIRYVESKLGPIQKCA